MHILHNINGGKLAHFYRVCENISMDNDIIFYRNIYKRIKEWKHRSNGRTALLIEGARRIGKSTIAEEFAKNEYRSYLLINFADTVNSYTKDVQQVFNNIDDFDSFFNNIQVITGTKLYRRESLIIFDEVQKNPRVREMIKQLVADGRYDYIETGSLMSLKKNSKKIVIPSEEEKIEMYPMSFDEFLLAMSEELLLEEIFNSFNKLKPLDDVLHKKAYKLFRTYMAIGGMPQVVARFIETNSYEEADIEKRNIVALYNEDLEKISRKASSITPKIIYDNLSSLYSNHSFELITSSFGKNTKLYTCLNNVDELEKSKIVNVAYDINNIDSTLSLGFDSNGVKVYSGDTGLLITKMFFETSFKDNMLYKSIILDKLSINEGYLFENVVAQTLRSINYKLIYNTFYLENSNKLYSIDFLIKDGKKICPIEVKSSSYKSHVSFDYFCKKYSSLINKGYIIYSKNLVIKDKVVYLPIYMTMCLCADN